MLRWFAKAEMEEFSLVSHAYRDVFHPSEHIWDKLKLHPTQ